MGEHYRVFRKLRWNKNVNNQFLDRKRDFSEGEAEVRQEER